MAGASREGAGAAFPLVDPSEARERAGTGPTSSWRADAAICACVLVALLAIAAWLNWPRPTIQNEKLAWEYGNTAAALVTGRGFSDPFEGVESGATAWMPPGYVVLIAGVFAAFGVKSSASVAVLLGIKYCGVALSLFLLLRIAALGPRSDLRWLLVLAFLGSIAANRGSYFLALHDVWLVLLLSCAILWSFVMRWCADARSAQWVAWLLAALLPITAPALALGFAALEAVGFGLRRRGPGRAGAGGSQRAFRFAPVAAAALLFVGSFTAWGWRNVQALGEWLPSKSNLWFDLVQANRFDDDGLVTNATFLAFNPSNPNRIQQEYAALGEAAFTRLYRERAMAVLREDPRELARRVARRAGSAFVWLHDPDDARPIAVPGLSPADLDELTSAGLAVRDWRAAPVWVSLTLDEATFATRLAATSVRAREELAEDWGRSSARMREERRHWTIVGRGLALVTLPAACLALGIAWGAVRGSPVFWSAGALYGVTLLPYVLVSLYLRYQTPLIGVDALLFFAVARELWPRALARIAAAR